MTTFPDAVRGVEVDTARNEITARVAAARIVDVARWLHDTPEASFDHITDICSVDYPNDPERFEVVYQLLSLAHRRRIQQINIAKLFFYWPANLIVRITE